jgi:hypothetical protein
VNSGLDKGGGEGEKPGSGAHRTQPSHINDSRCGHGLDEVPFYAVCPTRSQTLGFRRRSLADSQLMPDHKPRDRAPPDTEREHLNVGSELSQADRTKATAAAHRSTKWDVPSREHG